ncbi:DUF1294 domain-containing protein [Gorillibacterium sp. sgz5001074]|uniref:DUF1294 domain-containing protein n=1 Tax=Gorillibacterium sp. sgz5001074 TaxID=3446695 RepID=UPI003F66319D
MWIYLLVYALAINAAGIMMMRSDKARAKKGRYRVPERRLFVTAILGGSIGIFTGMQLYRHKTKHASFYIGIPAILIAQLILLGYLWGMKVNG